LPSARRLGTSTAAVIDDLPKASEVDNCETQRPFARLAGNS
jgi:hypothetical protein